MPFDVFKARVKIVRDEAVVKQWIDEQSYKTQYICLNVPDPLQLGSRLDVEKHFRETHLPHVVQQVESYVLQGPASRSLPCQPLQALVRRTIEEQRRFPLRMVTVLSQMFASLGLQFFKVNKTVTHVSVSRPHALDLATTPVSEGVKRIIDFIDAHPRCTRRQLIEALAPAPAAAPPAEAAGGPIAADVAPPAQTPPPAAATMEAPAISESAPETAGGPAVETGALTPEARALTSDLHWLIHQGHVIEFANGALETAKMPPPRPVKAPEKAARKTEPAPVSAESAPPTAPSAEFSSPPAEPESQLPPDATGAMEQPVPPSPNLDNAAPVEPLTGEFAAPAEAPKTEPAPPDATAAPSTEVTTAPENR